MGRNKMKMRKNKKIKTMKKKAVGGGNWYLIQCSKISHPGNNLILCFTLFYFLNFKSLVCLSVMSLLPGDAHWHVAGLQLKDGM